MAELPFSPVLLHPEVGRSLHALMPCNAEIVNHESPVNSTYIVLYTVSQLSSQKNNDCKLTIRCITVSYNQCARLRAFASVSCCLHQVYIEGKKTSCVTCISMRDTTTLGSPAGRSMACTQRKFFVGGNWKMNGNKASIDGIISFLSAGPLSPNTGDQMEHR